MFDLFRDSGGISRALSNDLFLFLPSKSRSIYLLCQWLERRSRLVLTTIEIPFSLQSVLRMSQTVLRIRLNHSIRIK